MIGAAILNYNGRELLLQTLVSLKASTRPPDAICVVDNASQDGSARAVRSAHPDVHVIELPQNRGGPGINAGFEWLAGQGCTALWKLDNDIELDSRCIEKMAAAARQQPRTILSPLIFYADPPGKIWFTGGHMDWEAMSLVQQWDGVEQFRQRPQRDRFISGCAMWIPTEVYRAIGGYSPRFFLYADDSDYSVRAVRHGFSLDVVPDARLVHLVSASTGGFKTSNPVRMYHMLRSTLLFWRRHLGFWAFHREYCEGHLFRWVGFPPGAEAREAEVYDAKCDAIWFVITGRRCYQKRLESPAWFRRFMRRRAWVVIALMSFDFRALLGRGAKPAGRDDGVDGP